MAYDVITISREFGSGGRTIGKEVAKKLGIPCYDQEIIEKLAEQSGFSKDYIADKGKDYRFQVAEHPIKQLQDRKTDNVNIGRVVE